jgi:hypothetical protein
MLSLVDLCDWSEDAAHKMLCTMRWPDTDGAQAGPNGSCAAVYDALGDISFSALGAPFSMGDCSTR